MKDFKRIFSLRYDIEMKDFVELCLSLIVKVNELVEILLYLYFGSEIYVFQKEFFQCLGIIVIVNVLRNILNFFEEVFYYKFILVDDIYIVDIG